MKYLRSFLPAVIIASTVVAEEPIAAKYFAQKVTTDNGYTQALLLPNGTLEYVVAFTAVADETNPHTWQVPAGIKEGIINYLVVAGGGGGGGASSGGGGGGGAGGMLTGILTGISANTDLNIVVGAGGSGATGGGSTLAKNGADSSITAVGQDAIIAYGGGAGGSAISKEAANGSDGGSGGGGAGTSGSLAYDASQGGAGIPDQGNNGGNRTFSTSGNSPGAGGGGAGGGGTSVGSSSGIGHGGNGRSSYIVGVETWYAGGGGGGSYNYYNAYRGNGGKGGGGKGGGYNDTYNSAAYSGEASTGGGGGGGRGANRGGSGGSGIVVLRYALNDDDFQGIVIDSTTEKFGSPDITYGLYPILPSSGEYTFPRFSDVSEGVRAVCVGCELWNKDETVLIDEYADDYRDNQSTADTVQYAIGENKGVVLKWKFIKEYYVSTVTSCERGSLVEDKSGWYREGDTINVAITSMDNFVGWGGWGDGTQRLIEQSKLITVVAAPMTITAYFSAHKKDNLILNGDFEINNNSSHSKGIIRNFDRLTAGSWTIVKEGTKTICFTGILAAQKEGCTNTGIKTYNAKGLSAIMAGNNYINGRTDAVIETDVRVTDKGEYKFSCIGSAGYHNTRVVNSKWVINVLLVDEDGKEISLGQMVHQYDKNRVWDKQYESYCRVKKPGVYKLRFALLISSISDNDSTDGKNPGNFAHSALDNIKFCLDKVYGLSVIVR